MTKISHLQLFTLIITAGPNERKGGKCVVTVTILSCYVLRTKLRKLSFKVKSAIFQKFNPQFIESCDVIILFYLRNPIQQSVYE